LLAGRDRAISRNAIIEVDKLAKQERLVSGTGLDEVWRRSPLPR
jgi:hypothetical protein